MLEMRKGDIFDSGCEAITNACNCVGIMGAGLAYAFKRKFPAMNKDYKQVCADHKLKPGIMHIWENTGNPKYIVNFPTKDDLSPSKMEYITTGLVALEKEIKDRDIKSIALPALGSGLGGLAWPLVKDAIKEWAANLPDVLIVLYEPWEKQ